MLELCIDSSAGAAVAIVKDGAVVARVREDDPRRHAEALGPLIREALAQAEIEGPTAQWGRIGVGTGPAPFTGLRSGLATAAVFARAWRVPVYGVPSLAIIGRQALDLLPESTEVIVVTDARRKEIYWAKYVAEGPDSVRTLEPPQVSAPTELASILQRGNALVVGPGVPIVQAVLDVTTGPVEHADPAVISRLVASALAADPEADLPIDPLYLRRPDIHNGASAKQ